MNFPVQHYDLFLVHLLHEKLDTETSKEWELNRKSERPTVKEFLEFLIPVGRALSNAQMYENRSNDAKRKSNERDHKFDSKKARTETASRSNAGQKSAEGNFCKMCNETGAKEKHPLYNCPKFQKLDLKSRRLKIREFGLCFLCLSPEHQVQACTKDDCRRCQGKHNSVICPENPKVKAINTFKKENKKSAKSKQKKKSSPKSSSPA